MSELKLEFPGFWQFELRNSCDDIEICRRDPFKRPTRTNGMNQFLKKNDWIFGYVETGQQNR